MSKKKLIILISICVSVAVITAVLLILLLPVKVTLYSGSDKIGTVSGKAGTNTALTIPEATDGTYFTGYYTDKALTKYAGNTFKRFTNKLYAGFSDYKTQCTDTFENKDLTVKLPNISDGYYQTAERFGLCFKEFCFEGLKLADTEKWSTPGVVIITDSDGYPFIANENTHYTITLTYKINKIGDENIKISSGYGLNQANAQKLKDTEFVKLNSAKTFKQKTDDFATVTFSFTTSTFDNNLPVTGIYANLNPGDEIIIKEIKIEQTEIVSETVDMSDYNNEVANNDVRIFQNVKPRDLSFANGKKVIALTYDDGPNEFLNGFVELFRKYEGAPTFFLIGFKCKNEYLPVLEYAVQNYAELGNHSATHGKLTEVTDYESKKAQMSNFTDDFERRTGYKMKIGRLPYHAYDEAVIKAMDEIKLPIIGSGVSTDELTEGSTPESIANALLNNAFDGAIVGLHVTDKTLKAMEIALPQLYNQGYRFVTVSELFKINGYPEVPYGTGENFMLKKAGK